MNRVVIESPYQGDSPTETIENIHYGRACLKDCLNRGEAPYASHLLYTQPGVLDDDVSAERARGIAAGFEWGDAAHIRAVYVDLGISEGMRQGIDRALRMGQKIEMRRLDGAWSTIRTKRINAGTLRYAGGMTAAVRMNESGEA